MAHAKAPEDMEYLEYITEEVLFGGHNYSRKWECTAIVGHTPTFLLNDDRDHRIYRKGNGINVECGLGFGGLFGIVTMCLCFAAKVSDMDMNDSYE